MTGRKEKTISGAMYSAPNLEHNLRTHIPPNSVEERRHLNWVYTKDSEITLPQVYEKLFANSSIIERIDKDYQYLVGKNILEEGFFIVWNGKDSVGKLDQDTYMQILKEAKQEGVKSPYHVYARTQSYQTNKVKFYQIPDKILLHLGLNENSESY